MNRFCLLCLTFLFSTIACIASANPVIEKNKIAALTYSPDSIKPDSTSNQARAYANMIGLGACGFNGISFLYRGDLNILLKKFVLSFGIDAGPGQSQTVYNLFYDYSRKSFTMLDASFGFHGGNDDFYIAVCAGISDDKINTMYYENTGWFSSQLISETSTHYLGIHLNAQVHFLPHSPVAPAIEFETNFNQEESLVGITVSMRIGRLLPPVTKNKIERLDY